MLIATGIASLIFMILWSISFANLGVGPFQMDPHGAPGKFEEHLKRYQNFTQLLITLATATIAYLVNFLLNLSNGKPENAVGERLQSVCPIAITLLGWSIVFGFLFIALESLAYEAYSHREGARSNYSRLSYATNLAFGYSAAVSFLLAYGVVGFSVLRQATLPKT
jgi:hypothetical protein